MEEYERDFERFGKNPHLIQDLSHQVAQLLSLEFDEGKRNELLGLSQTIQSMKEEVEGESKGMREEMDRKVGEIVGEKDRLIEELRREMDGKVDELKRENGTKRRISSTSHPRSDRGEQENQGRV